MTCACPKRWCYGRADCRHQNDGWGLRDLRLAVLDERRQELAAALAVAPDPGEKGTIRESKRTAFALIEAAIARLE